MPATIQQELQGNLGGNPLVGTPGNPTRDPKRQRSPGSLASDGTMGDQAFRVGVAIVLAAWSVLFLLGYSLRAHNV